VVDVPGVVRNRAVAAGAEAWLDDLPGLLAGLARDWGLAVGRAHDGGSEAYVTDVTLADGTPGVLKLLVPRPTDDARHEATVLRLADGEGCARLLRDDLDRGALLLERLGRPMSVLGLPAGRRHELLCAAATRLWRPAAGCGLPTGADKGRWLIDHVTSTWEALDRPCPERVVAHAVACAERRVAAHDDERAVLVHGDVHQWNALASGDGFRLVDPDGLLAEAEYDLGVITREDPIELLAGDPRDRAHRLAALTGRDPTATWEWGVVERVSTGLLCTRIGLQPVGAQMLAAAEAVAALAFP
jgi:streptomycin 6-kinase